MRTDRKVSMFVLCLTALTGCAPARSADGRSGVEAEAQRFMAASAVNAQAAPVAAPAGGADTVHIASPTGERETDRDGILAAVERVLPGGTVQFAPGTYLVGRMISIATPGITLLGHPDGTMLRGCDASGFDDVGRDMVATWMGELDPDESRASVDECGIFGLTGGHATVRGLTFEHAWSGLILGCCEAELQSRPTDGGYLIEDNTFRNIINGVRGILWAPEPTVIRGNRFVNTFHAVSAFGSRLHVLDNQVSVPDPARVSAIGYPGFALAVAGGTLPNDEDTAAVPCDGNVIAGNRVEGHPDGIIITAFPGTTCRQNVIRENTIVASTPSFDRARPSGRYFGAADTAPSIITGVPLSLFAFADQDGRPGAVRESEIEGNRVIGAHGVGIELVRASGNRIVNNAIMDIRRRDPFPGNVIGTVPEWADASGAGIWVSPGSNDNAISGNTFENVSSDAIVLEGDRNGVEVRSASDIVRDMGSENEVRRVEAVADSVLQHGPAPPATEGEIITSVAAEPAAERPRQSPYESRFADVRGIRLHYLDFGGTGLPLIFVHDWYEDAHTWATMAPPFADAHRVLAMTRRGYGQSDDVGWGYDVATQAEDILGFMDALGIQRAVLVGRHPTTQDMTWIAEHHPQRLAGLVYLYHAVWPSPGDARILRDRTFAEMFNRYGGCWMGEEAYERAAPRLLYRPHYIDDERRRIDVPALSFTHPQDLAAGMGGLDLLDLTLAGATSPDPGGGFCDPVGIETSVAWLSELARDAERLAAARALVPTSAERRGYAEAFERAFGSNLRVVRLDGPTDYRTDPGAYHSDIRSFLAGLVGSDTVYVGPPTGARQVDGASILTALPAVQEGEPIVIGQRLTLRSGILGEDRQILVRVPDGYERGNARYPVIYVLDGEFHFLHVSGATRVLGDRIPAVIIVGVENVDRDRDLTPPTAGDPFVIPVPFSADTARFQLDTAAARTDDFLRFLHEELAPFIDGRYRTAPFRLLFGHSLGGLFATHSFLTRPETFNAWIASSPSLAYYRSALEQLAPERLTTDEFDGRFFFSTVGEEEPWNAWGDGTLAWAFERYRPAGLRWWHRVLPGESHGTVPYRTAFDGLRTIFSDFAIPFPTLVAGDLPAVEAHLARASATYRYEIEVPEILLHVMGHERLGFGDVAGAIRIFRRNVELHPASPGVYDALADALEADGQLDEALHNRAKALRCAEQQGDARLEAFRRSLEALRARMTGGNDTGTGNRIAGPAAAVQRQPDTVRVAAPTGERGGDRASILEALAQVQPGGTVQFAPGAYLIGPFIDVAVPRITLVGHPDGTTIRGCDPAGFADMAVAMVECNGLNLTGGGQTVRALAFEHTWHALVLGGLTCEPGMCRPVSPPIESRTGGYVVEGSTFRESQNGIRVVGEWSEPAVIRDNRFINTYHAVVVNGMVAHIVDNLISVPDPERVPYTRHPGGALGIMGWDAPDQPAACDSNVIARNRITGHPDAILIAVAAGGACRGNAIRDNTIESYPVRFTSPSTALTVRSPADSTVAGVPIALLNGVFGDGTIENNLVEENRIVGASGLAVQVTGASRNRIVNNTITGVAVREPFPGNTLFPGLPGWRDANGSGIWVSAGSEENEIIGNTFEEIAAAAVFLEGDRNRVETRGAGDVVRDVGSGNRVMRTGRPAAHLEALYRARTDSARTRFSAADVRFVSGMIPHHAQAIVMSRLAPSRDASPAVRLLAERIITAQEDEIALLQQWLRERGQPVPEVDLTLTTHTAHGPAHTAHAHGMLTGEQMRALEAATAREFDRLFLESMIRHHLGAITMVDELFSTDAAAQDPAVSRLASAIQADQAVEIVRMRRMLAELSLTGRIR